MDGELVKLWKWNVTNVSKVYLLRVCIIEQAHNARCLSAWARGCGTVNGRRGSRPGSVSQLPPPAAAARVAAVLKTLTHSDLQSVRTRRLYQVSSFSNKNKINRLMYPNSIVLPLVRMYVLRDAR